MASGRSGLRFSLAAPALLIVLLAVLATLQYRWIGELAEAERERMQRTVRSSAERVAEGLDREITRAFVAFRLPAEQSPEEAARWLAEAAQRWTSNASFRGLVREVFLAQRDAPGGLELGRVDLVSGRLEPVGWTVDLESVRKQLETAPPPPPPPGDNPGLPPRGAPGFVVEDVPALVSPARRLWSLDLDRKQSRGGDRTTERWASPSRERGDDARIAPPDSESAEGRSRPDSAGPRSSATNLYAVLRLDRQALLDTVRQLVLRHVGESSEYDFAVMPRSDPGRVIANSRAGFPREGWQKADVEVTLFSVGARRSVPSDSPRPFGSGGAGPPPRERGARLSGEGVWRLVISHRAGSLEAAVAAARRRNLAVSGGVLALLAGAVAVLLVSVQRAQRLARQQLDFIAAITHELRTPLAAIRSAGQNLADGLVGEPDRVKRYGRLVEREGSRLTDLIEKSLEHAEIASGRKAFHLQPVAIEDVLNEAVTACRWLTRENDVVVSVEVPAGLPSVMGDHAALRTLFENLVSNGVKYGGRGSGVTVRARIERGALEVRVEDRGPGIPAEDLPHIFEPFYRGRDVSSGAIVGSGLGLSLVRKIAKTHGGDIRVESSAGGGSVFIVNLPLPSPAATPAAGHVEATS